MILLPRLVCRGMDLTRLSRAPASTTDLQCHRNISVINNHRPFFFTHRATRLLVFRFSPPAPWSGTRTSCAPSKMKTSKRRLCSNIAPAHQVSRRRATYRSRADPANNSRRRLTLEFTVPASSSRIAGRESDER